MSRQLFRLVSIALLIVAATSCSDDGETGSGGADTTWTLGPTSSSTRPVEIPSLQAALERLADAMPEPVPGEAPTVGTISEALAALGYAVPPQALDDTANSTCSEGTTGPMQQLISNYRINFLGSAPLGSLVGVIDALCPMTPEFETSIRSDIFSATAQQSFLIPSATLALPEPDVICTALENETASAVIDEVGGYLGSAAGDVGELIAALVVNASIESCESWIDDARAVVSQLLG